MVRLERGTRVAASIERGPPRPPPPFHGKFPMNTYRRFTWLGAAALTLTIALSGCNRSGSAGGGQAGGTAAASAAAERAPGSTAPTPAASNGSAASQ